MNALEAQEIPCVDRAGPDLFSQPEVLLLLSALAITAGIDEFIGSHHNPKSLPERIRSVLGCEPKPDLVFHAAADAVRRAGLVFDPRTESRLSSAATAIHERISEDRAPNPSLVRSLRSAGLRNFLTANNLLRRVFPQKIYHQLLAEAEVNAWDIGSGRGQTALFHLGALSRLITGLETPGWTSVNDYRWQIIGLCQYGAEEGRLEKQPLMVQPDAVSVSTIHGAKGLEFSAVFLADVNARRFPSNYAKRLPDLPLSGRIVEEIDLAGLADNENYDGERRLMYVALTRAERFLFVSHSGEQTSRFIKELRDQINECGGIVTDDGRQVLAKLKYAPQEHQRDIRLATSFSDLRYYLECPHDFYFRKVLGFSPAIDQAFGYGRGVHNLMRAVHSSPQKWAAIASDRAGLEREIRRLIERGLFYLRYTTGDPARNMWEKGVRIVADYVEKYVGELRNLNFEPEKEFETLIEYEDEKGGALISGAIDIVRQDNPPRVTLIDFKSGDPESDLHQKLDDEQIRLQVALYAVAAKKELEYQPEQGLVRYLDAHDPSRAELCVPLGEKALRETRQHVMETACRIRDREFDAGPTAAPRDPSKKVRCAECDFSEFCGRYRTKPDGKARGSR